MILKYVNSLGEEVDFRKYETQIYQGQFHSSNWNVETIEQNYGTTITGFKKEALNLEIIVAIRGFKKENTLNNIFEIFEKDIFSNKLGKLYWGDYYINCVILSNETIPSETFYGAETSLMVYAPYPFWIKEISRDFIKESEEENNIGLDYPYDYMYDYTPDLKGLRTWYVDHFAPSNFNMIIYGPVVNPRILINGYPYEVFVTLQQNEYLIISNVNNQNTVVQYRNNGTTLNIFDLRGGKDTNQSIFKQIPGGNLTINWSGDFSFTIKLFTERGIPKWLS